MVHLMGWGHEKKHKNIATDLTPLELEGLVQALSDEEKLLLREIKSIFAVQISGYELHFHDLFFVRFLRARNFDIKKTTAMLNKYFTWRNTMNVDHLLNVDLTSVRDTIRTLFPHAYHGVDKMGRPIYIERMGLGDPGKLLQTLTTDQLTQYYVQRYEFMVNLMLPCASLSSGRCVEQLLSIVDLRGFSITHITPKFKSFLSAMSHVTQDFYPELLGKLFLLILLRYFLHYGQ